VAAQPAKPPAPAAAEAPRPIDIPPWFTDSFLDFQEELADAAKVGKRVLVYFGQDGCPYCRELMQTNFSQRAIVEKTRANFVAIALNLWGDRELTWLDGTKTTEKALAKALKVQFTPTLLFLDPASGQIVGRLNGYQPPERFSAALDHVIARGEKRQPLADYIAANVKETARADLNEQPFFLPPPFDLRRKSGSRPLAVLFETRHCAPCDEMHQQGFRRPEVQAQLKRLDVARFALHDRRELTAPDGRRLSADAWARELGVGFTPTLVFFDAAGPANAGREVFRLDGYTRPFHLASALEYVAERAWQRQPEFQRFVRDRAERLRDHGQAVELWK
jgi:thioredoxin-related protein